MKLILTAVLSTALNQTGYAQSQYQWCVDPKVMMFSLVEEGFQVKASYARSGFPTSSAGVLSEVVYVLQKEDTVVRCSEIYSQDESSKVKSDKVFCQKLVAPTAMWPGNICEG
jgi:hypothetical protein